MTTMGSDDRTSETRMAQVSRPALVLAAASSAAVIGAALAGFRFTLPWLLAAMAGCAVILVLGFRGGRVQRPILEPLDDDWDAGVQIAAPYARDVVAGPAAGHTTAA